MNQSLNKTQDAQQEAINAIDKAWSDYENITNILKEVQNITLYINLHIKIQHKHEPK